MFRIRFLTFKKFKIRIEFQGVGRVPDAFGYVSVKKVLKIGKKNGLDKKS